MTTLWDWNLSSDKYAQPLRHCAAFNLPASTAVFRHFTAAPREMAWKRRSTQRKITSAAMLANNCAALVLRPMTVISVPWCSHSRNIRFYRNLFTEFPHSTCSQTVPCCYGSFTPSDKGRCNFLILMASAKEETANVHRHRECYKSFAGGINFLPAAVRIHSPRLTFRSCKADVTFFHLLADIGSNNTSIHHAVCLLGVTT